MISVYAGVMYLLSILIDRWPPVSTSPDAQEIIYFTFVIVTGIMSYLAFVRWKPAFTPLSGIAGAKFLSWTVTAHFLLFHLGELPRVYRVWFWDIQYKLLCATRTPYYFFVDFMTFKYFGIFFLVLTMVGIYLIIAKKDRPQGSLMLPLSIGVALVMLFLQPIYDPRYFIPLSGPAACLATFYLPKIKPRSLRISALLALAFFGVSHLFGWAFLPADLSRSLSSLSIVTPAPRRLANHLDSFSRQLLTQIPDPAPPGGTLVVFYDQSRSWRVTPLLIFYKLKLHRIKGQEISMLFSGVDPIYPYRNFPWGAFIYPARKDDDDREEKSSYSWQDRDKPEKNREMPQSDTGLKNYLDGAALDRVNPNTILLVRIHSRGPQDDLPANVYELKSITRKNRGDVPAPVDRTINDNNKASTLTSGNRNIKPTPGNDKWNKNSFPGVAIKALAPQVKGRVEKMVHLETCRLLGNTYADIYRVEMR